MFHAHGIWSVAEEDLSEIIDFIANDSPESAENFAAALRTKVGKLTEYPKLYRAGRIHGTREMVVYPN
jgi:plasmid stabilization system protein ParE